MAYRQFTKNMAAGVGYVIDLLGDASTLSLLARAECWVQTVARSAAPTAPTVSAVAANPGDQTSYLQILANEVQIIGIDTPTASAFQSTDRVNYLLVWCVSAGNLVISVH